MNASQSMALVAALALWPANARRSRCELRRSPGSQIHAAGSPGARQRREGSRRRNLDPARRPEILELFERNMYGRSPGRPEASVSRCRPSTAARWAPGRSQAGDRLLLRTRTAEDGSAALSPRAARKPCPCSWAELRRNQTVAADPGIRLGDFWVNEAKQPAGRTPGVRRPASGRSPGFSRAATAWPPLTIATSSRTSTAA